MTALSIYEGEDKTWSVAITDSAGDPINITGYTFLFVVKRHRKDSDSNALIYKEITSHTSPTQGETQITIDSADTADLHGNFYYDYQWKDTSSKRKVILKNANFEVEQRIGDNFT